MPRIDRWNCTKLKMLLLRKELISRVKRHPTQCKKAVANYNSDTELISRMYTEVTK